MKKAASTSIVVSLPQKATKRSILDLSNWISSSDDDSFTQNILQDKDPKTGSSINRKADQNEIVSESILQKSPSRSLFRLVLHSSPVLERLLGAIVTTQPSAASKLRATKPSSKNTHLPFVASDPIESSSPAQSPKKKVASKKSTSGEWTTKEWRDANRTNRKKEEIMAEMVLEVALCINCKVRTPYFDTKFEGFVVRNTYVEVPLLSWKRRVNALYNKQKDVFEPCDLTEILESVYALFYDGADLVWKIKDGTVNEDINKVKKRAAHENPETPCHVFIVCPGFGTYLKKLQTNEDKEYRQTLLEQLDGSVAKKRRKALSDSEENITATEAQRLKVQTEVNLGINIFTCRDLDETIDWLYSFSYTIGSSLYSKYERNPDYANFGNVRLGTDKKSTFLKMIQHFNLVTATKADKIYQFYTSPLSMYQRFIEHDNLGTFDGKPVVPQTTNNAMRRALMSNDPSQVITD
ncbi:hypothetical protein PUMCH_003811 [Australozyma saopauloensis]|uniref:ERCC4 domain-containing protein n=1 Tax=Australozyma saopauloensis TaxID=291208 RepID=A0AAX4HF02_9ASCO|nr:hypothetical protein PUMCH_003811 [[Candida] saopauloensis]